MTMNDTLVVHDLTPPMLSHTRPTNCPFPHDKVLPGAVETVFDEAFVQWFVQSPAYRLVPDEMKAGHGLLSPDVINRHLGCYRLADAARSSPTNQGVKKALAVGLEFGVFVWNSDFEIWINSDGTRATHRNDN